MVLLLVGFLFCYGFHVVVFAAVVGYFILWWFSCCCGVFFFVEVFILLWFMLLLWGILFCGGVFYFVVVFILLWFIIYCVCCFCFKWVVQSELLIRSLPPNPSNHLPPLLRLLLLPLHPLKKPKPTTNRNSQT